MVFPSTTIMCSKCKHICSITWNKDEENTICNDCRVIKKIPPVNEAASSSPASKLGWALEEGVPSSSGSVQPNVSSSVASATSTSTKSAKKPAKSQRPRATRHNPNAVAKQGTPKGKSRRNIFKKNLPVKATTAAATCRTVNNLMFEGQLFTVGDIVSMRSSTDYEIFYGQIKGLMIDEYGEKSASFYWLLPTVPRSEFMKRGFDPLLFQRGPTDDLPHKLECFQFVMHAPSHYYDNNPWPTPHPLNKGFIWGRLQSPNN